MIEAGDHFLDRERVAGIVLFRILGPDLVAQRVERPVREHAPVAENCLNCHAPHGSNQENLLTLPVPMLCQQCHTNTDHPNDLLTRQSLRGGLVPDERVMERGCLNCHSNIHGSNNPNGAKFHQ